MNSILRSVNLAGDGWQNCATGWRRRFVTRQPRRPAPEYQARLIERLRTDCGIRRYDLLLVEDLEVLAAFQSQEYPVVSLYLDVRPEECQARLPVRSRLAY